MNVRLGRFYVRALGVAILGVAVAGVVYANHSWGNYHWERASNPLNLELGDNVSGAWDGHLAKASSDWNVSNVLNTTVVTGGTSARRCKASNGRVEVCADNYGYNGWLGIAQIWVDGDHITKGITKMNDSYFSLAAYNTSPWRQLVMCQEVGHTFGLGHQDEDFYNQNLGTCMDYTDDPDGSLRNQADNTEPNLHDYQQLAAIYEHLDGEAPPADDSGPGNNGRGNGRGKPGAPPAMDDIDFAGPAQWGKLVQGSRERGFSVYVLDFGGGHKVITHVLWVRPGNAKK